ncbi:MAG: VWA domain-containing protein [Terracidiphilus sp.]
MSKSQHICLLLFLCLTAVTFAQQAPVLGGPALGEGRIKLDVVVTDTLGKPVSGLALKDFTLLDNGQPSKILSFHDLDGAAQQGDSPVEVILVIDTINLPIQQIIYMRQEVEKFLRRNGGHLALPVAVFVLNDSGLSSQQPPSVDGNALAAEIDRHVNTLSSVLPSEGANGEFELFKVSVDALNSIVNGERRKPGRKLLIWAGHGWPMLNLPGMESSSKTRQQYFAVIVQLSTRLREARMSVYSISSGHPGMDTFVHEAFLRGVKSPDKASIPNLALRVLAIQSGGRVLGPADDVAGQIDSCIRDASAFYRLSFDPPRANSPNEYHDLKVQVAQPGLTARTNTGYYNQP